jgi:hypothetical protein
MSACPVTPLQIERCLFRLSLSTTLHEAFMATSNVIGFSENVGTMTFAEGLAFIERTRRQIDRFDALPHAAGETIDRRDAAEIRRQCDELEADINRSLSNV